jgi:hypothetical protein
VADDVWDHPALTLMHQRWAAGCKARGRPVTLLGEFAVLDDGEVDWCHARLNELVDAANYHWCELAEKHGSSNPEDWSVVSRLQLQQSVAAIEDLRARVIRDRRRANGEGHGV